jgi:hypothetical protein
MVDGSAVTYYWSDEGLMQGLLLSDGKELWFPNARFGAFREGFAVLERDEQMGFIDRQGNIVIEPDYVHAEDFSEGRAFVSDGLSTWLIDTSGRVVQTWNEPLLTWGFREGIARVSRMSGDGSRIKDGLVDRHGEFVLPISLEGTLRSPEDLLGDDQQCWEGMVRFERRGKVGFVDAAGRATIPARFQAAGHFSVGLCPAKLDGLYGYIGRGGEFVITPRFDYAGSFNDSGIARVKTHLSTVELGPSRSETRYVWWLMDRSERHVGSVYESLGRTDGDGIVFMADGLCGLLNNDGDIVIGPEYDEITPFTNGLCRFRKRMLKGFMDRSGERMYDQDLA